MMSSLWIFLYFYSCLVIAVVVVTAILKFWNEKKKKIVLCCVCACVSIYNKSILSHVGMSKQFYPFYLKATKPFHTTSNHFILRLSCEDPLNQIRLFDDNQHYFLFFFFFLFSRLLVLLVLLQQILLRIQYQFIGGKMVTNLVFQVSWCVSYAYLFIHNKSSGEQKRNNKGVHYF